MKYVLGMVGGLIGGLIGALPWILLYLYGNMLLSLLAACIAFGFYYGYKLFGGPVNKYTSLVVGISSILIVIVVTLLILPLLSLGKEGFEMSFYNLEILYESSEYVSALMGDLIISILFTILGIGGVITRVKQDSLTANNQEEKSTSIVYE